MARHEEREDSYDLLNQYLQEIAQIPRLTPEREKELGRRVQQNDKSALEELVKANLRFVVSYAKRYRNTHVLFLDLINEGNIGLIHAAKKYDPDKNVKFITYAVWWIRQSILHALSEQGGAFRLPPKRANLMYRLEKASRREELLAHISELSPKEKLVLMLRHGITDNMPKSIKELAAFLNRTPESVYAVVEMARLKVCDALAITESELAQLLLYTNPNPKAWWRYWYELGDLPAGMSPDIDTTRVPLLESLKQQGLVQRTVDALPAAGTAARSGAREAP